MPLLEEALRDPADSASRDGPTLPVDREALLEVDFSALPIVEMSNVDK